MPQDTAIRGEAARLLAGFEAAGAQRVEAPVLLSADTLLDLYGEDIRARAFTTHDPLKGELMLRPDFTVPVVERHMAHGAEPARYAYAGEVFRRQDEDPDRPSEYMQVGFEIFDRANPAAADAEVFALFARLLDGLPMRVSTGDYGILTAAVQGLDTSPARKAALMRHIWRPRRFRQLLDRFGAKTPEPEARAALIASDDPLAGSGPEIGLRSRADVLERIETLRADAATPPISDGELRLLDQILDLRGRAPLALDRLRDLAVDMPALDPAVGTFAARLDALSDAGVAVDTVEFVASFGRTTMEYYDGFVFGFMADDRADLPPVATGGRYDALTRVLGRGREIPAVGGVIRPSVAVAMREGAR